MKKSLILVTLLLAGCATASGPAYSPKSLKAPKAGMAQVVVFRPSQFAAPRSPDISINGVKKCELPSSSFAVFDVPAGKTDVSAYLWDMGAGQASVMANKGQRSFIGVKLKANTGGAFGLVGAVIANGISGPFEFVPAADESALTGLKQSTTCQ